MAADSPVEPLAPADESDQGMVLTTYMLAWAGGGFCREELREDLRAFAVTMLGALVFFGLFPRGKN